MSGEKTDGGGGPAPGASKRKVTLYFNATMVTETQQEAIRQDRSISWIIQAAWRKARDEIRRLPAGARVRQGGDQGGDQGRDQGGDQGQGQDQDR